MNGSSPHVDAYRQEAEELLAEIEETVLDLEENPEDSEAINRLFRAMHTIKGSGAMFGFDDIAEFTHHVETALDRVREGRMAITKELIDLVLSSRDLITAMLAEESGGAAADREKGSAIIAKLKAVMGEAEVDDSAAPSEARQRPDASALSDERVYRIRFEPEAGIFTTGMDPAHLLDDLLELGECSVVAHWEMVPELSDLLPESCYLTWDVTLTTARGAPAIEDVFIFLGEESSVHIEELETPSELTVDEPPPKIGEILVGRGDVSRERVEEVLGAQQRVGELLVSSGALPEARVQSALNEQQAIERQKNKRKASSVRVPSARLDQLINLVGELVITQARLTQVATGNDDTELSAPVEEVERLTGELRDCVLNVRMVEIGTTFSKFRRLVRDLSGELGKSIELVTLGGETELDKTIIERLNDPLIHLIRNSIDHGIEPPAVRSAAGKKETGVIRLAAAHRGANVVITIEDDGKGLDASVIREKAEARGLIARDAELSEKEIFAQIFAPGFSTSESVTSVSGRGVGMDVVKRTIESLRGVVEIDSSMGAGSTISLSLPLTLAIINGLLVTIGKDYFVLPLMSVEECVELSAEDVARAHGSNILNVRGDIVPFIRLREHFAISGEKPALEHVVITDINTRRIGFVVDHVIGGYQTVIKSLGPAFARMKDISGATILGDGTVALILDVNSLV